MKKMSKLFTLVLAIMMILSLAAPAFAAEELSEGHNHTITIENAHSGYTYEAYQIFAGDLDAKGILSNIKWGSSITNPEALLTALAATAEFAGVDSVDKVATILSSCTSMDDPIAKKFASVVSGYVGTSAGASSYANGVYSISGLEDGYYLVINTEVPDATDTTYSRYILEVVRNITVTHKGTYPTVVKKIVEGEEKVDVNTAGIGQVVNYEIVGTLPTNINDYMYYFYQFRDTLSKGLTYNEDITVTVNGVDVTAYFDLDVSDWNESTGTTINVGISDLLMLDNADVNPDQEGNQPIEGMTAITKNTKVVLTYSATVNEFALVAAANPNDVDLVYSNNPNVQTPPPSPDVPNPEYPVGVTPKDEVETYMTELTIFKKDGQGNALEGAEFELAGTAVKKFLVTKEIFTEAATTEEGVTYYYKLADKTYTTTAPTEETKSAYDEASLNKKYTKEVVKEVKEQTETVKIRAFVGTDGYLTFTGLSAGEYTLTETTTPSGYNTIAPISFEIEFNEAEKKFHADGNSWIMVEADNTLLAEIINVAGSTLPSTGGIGTTLFYLSGSVMAIGAGILLITKKRMAA